MSLSRTVSVNGRSYRLPTRPVVVVCIDGSEPLYFDRGIADGTTPSIARFRAAGFTRLARSAMPSFTNPNNVSIVTGAPPSVHGICGNYFYDVAAGREVMMNDPRFLRCGTVLAALSRAGARAVVITAKDKLRRLLGHGMDGICFSAEKADQVTKDEHGIARVTDLIDMPVPPVYSAALSEYVLRAGLELLDRERPEIMYLSLTDYIQHKHPPGAPVATAFYAMLDRYFAEFDRAGVILGITADHGMNGKARADGTPNVVYLGPILDEVVGSAHSRVILPITDPYVVHHGALGSFATIHLERTEDTARVMTRLGATAGIADVYDNATGARLFELPPDRVGDVIVVADAHTVLGKSPATHDLSLLEEPLRSHGGPSEVTVPFIINRPVNDADAARVDDLRNFDIFDFVLNGVG